MGPANAPSPLTPLNLVQTNLADNPKVRRSTRMRSAVHEHNRCLCIAAAESTVLTQQWPSQHVAAAIRAAKESCVLLSNMNSTLPLSPAKVKRLLVLGPNADEVESTILVSVCLLRLGCLSGCSPC